MCANDNLLQKLCEKSPVLCTIVLQVFPPLFRQQISHRKMTKLTEEMVIARTRQSDLSTVKKLNCWYVAPRVQKGILAFRSHAKLESACPKEGLPESQNFASITTSLSQDPHANHEVKSPHEGAISLVKIARKIPPKIATDFVRNSGL